MIVRAVPKRPWYIVLVLGPLCNTGFEKEPCACSLVLMTSRGQVTMPLAIPAIAPEKELILAGGREVVHIANLT